MSNTKNTGGPAFPVNTANQGERGACFPDAGMTLRDYFAAKAMNGLLSDHTCEEGTWEDFAKAAYSIADAMLQAREQ